MRGLTASAGHRFDVLDSREDPSSVPYWAIKALNPTGLARRDALRRVPLRVPPHDFESAALVPRVALRRRVSASTLARRWMSRLANAAAWVLFAMTAVWAVFVLLDASNVSMSLLGYLAYVYGGVLVAVLTACCVCVPVVRAFRWSGQLWRSIPVRVIVQAGILVLVLVAVALDLAFALRFRLSEPALTHAALDIQSGRHYDGDRWIGLFRVHEINRAGSAVRLITGECFFDDCGLAFNTDGAPPVVDEDDYAHLSGPWWRWRRSW